MEIKPNFGQQVSELARSDRNGGIGKTVSAAARDGKVLKDKAILDASLNVSISTGNRSLELVYRAAVDKLNELLADDLGPDALQYAIDNGLDVSPEATAGRILSMSTAFLPAYLEQHPELGEDEGRARFIDLIRGGIEQGFSEARDILQGLGVLEGDIAANIDTTWELVQQGLDDYLGHADEASDPF
ncbi:hypothetical protein GCM10011348_18210 [Marinobacterium nitratireducens]|uniref:DUF5610 domain-containing protein n=1 Tax=Marinobacterium nitratireducens TaxID=518897 RepID=A0A918DRL6_9GAMM|nr:DUF5610 domain-containing protein [Marinobacterium nitratireducens]GGO80771.1 hypothetical protein GCM10011348_18210 [Marinobacterium nitratireducens]